MYNWRGVKKLFEVIWAISIIMLLTTVLFLRSLRMFLVQLILLVSLEVAVIDMLIIMVSSIQMLFILYVLFRIKNTIDYNYQLVFYNICCRVNFYYNR